MRHLATIAIAIATLVVLSGCAFFSKNPPPISANPVMTISNAVPGGPLAPGGTIVTGLQNAAFNLDQAISIKILPATDPADSCIHGFLQAIGQDIGQTPAPPAASFTPKVSDLISGGSVAYILAVQAKQIAANGGVLIPPSCEQLVGHLVITGVNAPVNAVISAAGGALP